MNSAPVGIDASGFAYDAVLLNDLFHPRMCLHKVRLVVRGARLQHKSLRLLRRLGFNQRGGRQQVRNLDRQWLRQLQ